MCDLTTEDMIQVVRRYFGSYGIHDVLIEVCKQTYEGREQSAATILMRDIPQVDAREFSFATKMYFHGYWKGRVTGPQWDLTDHSQAPIVQLVDDRMRDQKTSLKPSSMQEMVVSMESFLPVRRRVVRSTSSSNKLIAMLEDIVRRLDDIAARLPSRRTV